MNDLVLEECAGVFESFRAVVAGVGSLIGVNALVLPLRCGRVEPRRAVLTAVGLDPRVDLLVRLKTGRDEKRFGTVLTSEGRLELTVCSLVSLESHLLIKAAVADDTGEGASGLVDDLVLHECATVYEPLLTDTAGVGSLASVGPLMNDGALAGNESLVTLSACPDSLPVSFDHNIISSSMV